MDSLDTQNQSEADVSHVDPSQSSDSTPKRSYKPWLGLLCAVPVAIGGVVLWRSLTPAETTKPAVAQAPKQPPRPVETTQLGTGTAQTSTQLLGQVEASQQSTVRAQTGGVVEEIFVQPGDRVAAGTVIAILDDADQQLSISQARAQLAQQRSNLARLEVGTRPEIIAQRQAGVNAAKAREQEAQDNLQRTTTLVREGAVSQRLLVEARSAVDAAKGERLAAEATLAEAKAGPIQEEIAAQKANVAAAVATVNQAELNQRRTKIAAAESGVVQTRHVSRGDLVQPSGQIATLVAGNQFDVFLELPENLSGKISPGMPIALTTRTLPNWKGQTTITAVVPSADSASRRQRVRVQLANPPQGLLPGVAVSGALSLPANRPGFVVSRDVLTRRQNKWLVFAITDGKAKPIPVEMVADMGKQVSIHSPELKAGQAIVLRGGDGLADGMPVKVVGGAS
jgi:HlyD family secretion protein